MPVAASLAEGKNRYANCIRNGCNGDDLCGEN
jgi:hypothetical protein